MSDEQLEKVANDLKIIARARPMDKNALWKPCNAVTK